jgi:hypothetical protein
MNTKFLKSCAALALLGLGGAVSTEAQAGGSSAGVAATHSTVVFAPRTGADSLLKTTNSGAISVTEQALSRNNIQYSKQDTPAVSGAAALKYTSQ